MPLVVTIKRKRDEPALPEFVLASKRPSLARLTLDDHEASSSAGVAPSPAASKASESLASPSQQGSRAAKKAGTRYRLVGTKSERDGIAVRADAAALLTAAHEQAAKEQQSRARYQKVQLRRSANSAEPDVLELQRCAAESAPAPKRSPVKLVPFGPPLPKTSKPEESVSRSGHEDECDDALLAAIWADAAAASAEAVAEAQAEAQAMETVASGSGPAAASGGKAASGVESSGSSDDYVYDEYAMLEPSDEGGEGEGGEGEGGGSGGGAGDQLAGFVSPGGWEVPEIDIWWEEEADSELVRELEAAAFGYGESDSEGEDKLGADYPDEESGDDSDGDFEDGAYRLR